MTSDQAANVINGSMAITVLVSTVTLVRTGKLAGPRIVVAAFAVAIVLNLIAEAAPDAAAGVAVTILVGTLVSGGSAASVSAIGSAVSGKKPKYEAAFDANRTPAAAAFFGPH